MKLIFYIAFILGISTVSSGQSAVDDLKSLIESCGKNKDYNYKIKYAFYGEGKPMPIETVSGVAQQFGKDYYYKLGPIEQVSDSDITLTLNRDENYVIADKTERYYDDKNQFGFKEIMADMQENGDQLQTEKNTDGTYKLKVYKNDQKKPSWVINYERESFHLKSLVLYFNEEETEAIYGEEELKTSWLEITLNQLLPGKLPLQVGEVLLKEDKSVRLQPKYKNFKLYNLSENK